MADILLLPSAEEDYTGSLCWYAERNSRAATMFEEEFEHALDAIAAGPERYPLCDDQHRFFLMRRYPFHVIYRIHRDAVIIVAVAHTKRRPRYWATD